MKKIVIFFVTIIIVGLASAQSVSKEKSKSSLKDTVKKKGLVAKQEKPSSIKDTVKKNKSHVEDLEVVSDSLLLAIGDFSFYKKSAHASYYADKFHGRKTASGKKYDKNKYTAAHKKLPFGSKVKVTNEANGKSVIVEITDRGPFVRAREIDLSRRAFMEITNNKASGGMKVTIELLKK